MYRPPSLDLSRFLRQLTGQSWDHSDEALRADLRLDVLFQLILFEEGEGSTLGATLSGAMLGYYILSNGRGTTEEGQLVYLFGERLSG